MIEKNTYYQVEFTDLTHDAMGVCKVDNYPIFVKDALKGETALIKVIKMNKNFGFGRLIEIIKPSPFRKIPICEHYDVCGGCNMMHMNYDMQLNFKKFRTKETLQKLGHITVDVQDTVGLNNPYYYRNKAIIPFGLENGKMVAGLYKERSHDIVNIKRCHVFPKIFSDIIRHLKQLFESFEYSIYDEDKHQGLIKAIMLRESRSNQTIGLTIVTSESKLPQKEMLVSAVIERFPNIVSIVHNVNSEKTNVMLGNRSKAIFGEDMIEDELLGLKYTISHRAFYQINPEQTERLYKKAIEMAALKKEDVVVDAYCGIGTIGLTAAKHVQSVIGIDVIKESIKNAQQNAKNNTIHNAQFILGKAEEVLPKLKHKKIDVIFIDPPRKGVEKVFLESLVQMNIPKIVYISCNVSTLARDLNYLQSQNYEVQKVIPFDMFPQTSHIETVCLLTRKPQA